jgi:predicted DCC family thiol-disulfide oxidoreductase YuxK
MSALRVYYDGLCPLCVREMNKIKELDSNNQLDLQDINATDFSERFPHIDPVKADRILHGELPDGRVILGLDVTCLAWKIVGKGHWFGFMRWPLIGPVADQMYLLFARHRHRISSWFGERGSIVCDDRCKTRL